MNRTAVTVKRSVMPMSERKYVTSNIQSDALNGLHPLVKLHPINCWDATGIIAVIVRRYDQTILR